MGDYYGLRTQTISNGFLSIEFLLDAGPRLVRLFYKDCVENLLAEIPERTHQSEYGTFYFRGGHRLWHAPEDIRRTYIPDNEPILVMDTPDGVTITQPVEVATGIQKSIHIQFCSGSAKVVLQHTLLNQGMWPVTLSAWAITQLPLGGMAVLPQTYTRLDTHGLLPNRNLSIWSYTSITDPRLTLSDDTVLIKADSALPPLKIGYTNRTGWIGYYRQSILFVKHFTPILDLSHPDFNCNTETYCGNQFIELETLSPLITIEPGESIIHNETWEIISGLHVPLTPDGIRTLIIQAGLANN
jgi:hypothetical protein